VSEQNLLPCPFCGATAGHVANIGVELKAIDYAGGMHLVVCHNCGVEARRFYSPEPAIAAWNRRQPVQLGGWLVDTHRDTEGSEFQTGARHLDLRGVAATQEEAAAIFGLAGDAPYTFEEVHLVLTDRCIAFVLTEPQIAKLIAAGGRPC
jgi:Lar family restriction alleviation protein